MKATQQLHDLGQSLWQDNITRMLHDDGTLVRHSAENSITGLTTNPSIFAAAIGSGDAHDAGIHVKTLAGLAGDELFIELALEDLRRAADLFRPVFDATDGVDGWASLEVSPLFADDSAKTIHAAAQLHAGAARPNIFIKIPGTLGFGGEESAGAPFQRLDGSAWTTDKDGIALALLSAEMTARTGRYPGALYRDLCTEFGEVFADRVEARANAEQKRALAQLTPQQIAQTELAGEPIDSVLADI